jgi:hypothetical protein
MALFIQPDNQNLLWEMIHKIAILHSIFPEGSPIQEKNVWFKQHIEKKYGQLPPNLSRNDLAKVNREVLSDIVDDLKKRANISATIPSPNMNLSDNTRGTFSRLQNSVKKPDYETTALQYNSLFEVPKPKVIDFTEKIDDEIITNMDELIENHRKMREQDLQEFMPAATEPTNQLPPSSSRIKILEDIESKVHTIEPKVHSIEPKHVSFHLPEDNPPNKSGNNDMFDMYTKLHDKYDNMDKKMDSVLELLNHILAKDAKDNTKICEYII